MTEERKREVPASAKRWLRSPVTITGEVLGAAVIGVVRATVPQGADAGAWARFAADQPGLARVVRATWLDRVVVSPWAVAVFGLSALSLGIVFVEVTQRAVRRWRTPPAERSFASAPFSAEVERSAGSTGVRRTVEVRGRAGLLGVPLLHAGILILIAAGLVRALLGADAAAWVLEGETIEAGPASVQASETGFLARPLTLAEPVRLDALDLVLRADGSVERESARLSVGDPPRPVGIAINEAVDVGSVRLYLTQRHGLAVLLEGGAQGSGERRALMLPSDGDQFSGQDVLRDGTVVRARRAVRDARSSRPGEVDFRVLRGPTLLFTGGAAAGEEIRWPGGALRINGTVPWVEIKMSDDPSTPLAWVGVALVLLGITLFALVTPVDVLVAPSPATGGGEKVRVAMRPHRFAALHEGSFQALVERVRQGEER